jgi:hypothetical protein
MLEAGSGWIETAEQSLKMTVKLTGSGASGRKKKSLMHN